eukprot:TRINITY_DN44044_c0_g1_i1.p4 TRINITY_DN44044_c0_g1~~TRINITY_DN44044_c0_g1_i1.p4  ORF type:complete len:109 (-),score=4.92 TRINITY_DN44044_c0_g1_i1:635-961(-)
MYTVSLSLLIAPGQAGTGLKTSVVDGGRGTRGLWTASVHNGVRDERGAFPTGEMTQTGPPIRSGLYSGNGALRGAGHGAATNAVCFPPCLPLSDSVRRPVRAIRIPSP